MRMAEQKAEKETVKMVYKNGRMELYIHEFFPCTAAVARKVADDRSYHPIREFLASLPNLFTAIRGFT